MRLDAQYKDLGPRSPSLRLVDAQTSSSSARPRSTRPTCLAQRASSELALALDHARTGEQGLLGVALHAVEELGARRHVVDEAAHARGRPDAGVRVARLVHRLAASARDELRATRRACVSWRKRERERKARRGTHGLDLGKLDAARATLLGDDLVRDLVLEDTRGAAGREADSQCVLVGDDRKGSAL